MGGEGYHVKVICACCQQSSELLGEDFYCDFCDEVEIKALAKFKDAVFWKVYDKEFPTGDAPTQMIREYLWEAKRLLKFNEVIITNELDLWNPYGVYPCGRENYYLYFSEQ